MTYLTEKKCVDQNICVVSKKVLENVLSRNQVDHIAQNH